ncbi:MAG: hypothetical protein M1831_000974, partial [Alyxoria varia]
MVKPLQSLALLTGFVATATALAVPMPAPAADPEPCDGSHDAKCIKPRTADANANGNAPVFSPTDPGLGSSTSHRKRDAAPQSRGSRRQRPSCALEPYINPNGPEEFDAPDAPWSGPVDPPPKPGEPINPKTIVDKPDWRSWPGKFETPKQKQKREANANAEPAPAAMANAKPANDVESAEHLKKALKIKDAEGGIEPIITRREADANAKPVNDVESAEHLKKALKIKDGENSIEPIITRREADADAEPANDVESAEHLKKALKIKDGENGIEPIITRREADADAEPAND